VYRYNTKIFPLCRGGDSGVLLRTRELFLKEHPNRTGQGIGAGLIGIPWSSRLGVLLYWNFDTENLTCLELQHSTNINIELKTESP
jgi:hypothetical protein